MDAPHTGGTGPAGWVQARHPAGGALYLEVRPDGYLVVALTAQPFNAWGR
ncbi:hypothetical protein [Archangium sp.]|nr:hypothetical protein [Archangium sp.]HYO59770.1 hypothetical protein [Archangium sp.]